MHTPHERAVKKSISTVKPWVTGNKKPSYIPFEAKVKPTVNKGPSEALKKKITSSA